MFFGQVLLAETNITTADPSKCSQEIVPIVAMMEAGTTTIAFTVPNRKFRSLLF